MENIQLERKAVGTVARLDDAIYYLLIVFAVLSCISIPAGRFITSLAGIIALIRYYKEPIHINLDRTLLKAFGMLLLMVIVTGVFGYDPLQSSNRVFAISHRIVPLLLVVIFINDRKRLYVLVGSLLLSIFVADILAVWQGLHGQHRPSGFSNVMTFAGYLIQLLPLMLVLSIDSKHFPVKVRILLLLVTVISVVALGYNGTRGAWVAIAVVIAAFGIINFKQKRLIAYVLLIILAISVFACTVPVIKERVASIGDLRDQSQSERILLWTSAWNMFLDHPISGVGTGNFEDLYHTKYILPEAKERMLPHAHNNIMQILAENGALGILAFGYLFGYILHSTLKAYRANPDNRLMLAAFLVTIGFWVHGLTEYNIDDTSVLRIYWFILGLAYLEKNLLTCSNQY